VVRKVSVEQFTGSVSVDGDVTPITRQPVDKVNAGSWDKLSVSELHQQREILQRRYYQALSVGLVNAGAIEAGIKTIDAILENKGANDSLGFL
jgi:hypothetical protein